MVPLKPANGRPARSRSREGGLLVNQPLEGNRAGASEPGTVSTRQQRIAELRKAKLCWNAMVALLERLPLPAPRVVHSVYRSG